MGDLNGVVAVAVGLVCGAFGDPDGVVRAPPNTVEVFSEKYRESLLCVDLNTIGVNRKIDGVVAITKIDDSTGAVLDEVVTRRDGIGACAAESVGRRVR